MNERIKEFESQCWEPRQYGPAWFNSTKFAELIVKECNDVVLGVPCYYKDYRSQIEEAVINDCSRAILEHFGVE